MATTLISIAEYLRTSYRPDREYIDGVVLERNVGEYDHARLQIVLGSWVSSASGNGISGPSPNNGFG